MDNEDQTIRRYAPSVGDKIREYEIVEIIGKGGMATVYKALHNLINQVVALKIMKQSLTSDPLFCKRFLNEAQTQAQLTGHQNVVTIHNFFEEQNLYIIVMEYVDGIGMEGKVIRTLAEQIKNFGPIDAWHFKPILNGILSGLTFANEQGIIHRDIKPSNIMFSNRGIAKIADFGIAQIITEPRLTRTGIAVGTPKYMSPEQVRGKNLDIRSDIYSLGTTMYEVLTGVAPFDGETDYEIMRKQEEEEPIPPKKINSRIPDMWENLILMCIAKNPDERPQNYKEISTILEKGVVLEKQIEKKPEEILLTEKKPEEIEVITLPSEIVKTRPTSGIILGIIITTCVILTLLYYFLLYTPGRKSNVISDLKWTTGKSSAKSLVELQNKKFTSIGNVIAHAAYVEDAVIMDADVNLNEIITQLSKDEPEITFIHFTNNKNRIIASTDSTLTGKVYSSDLLNDSACVVRVGDGGYECGFSIEVGRKRVGALYFGATLDKKPKGMNKKELLIEKFTSIGNVIAHATYVEDAVIMDADVNLNEIITQLSKDEPEITFIHFTNNKNRIIASTDSTLTGKVYSSDLLNDSACVVRVGDGGYECGFSIEVGRKRVGALYFGAIEDKKN